MALGKHEALTERQKGSIRRLFICPIAAFEADGPGETPVVIGLIEAVDTDPPFSRGGMEEFVVADIDADMTKRSPRVEEEEIPFDQFAARDAHPDMRLLEGGPGEVDVEGLVD